MGNFSCYLCHVRFLFVFYFLSTKIGEISDISKCFEDFVSQALGVLTRNCAAELRFFTKIIIYSREKNNYSHESYGFAFVRIIGIVMLFFYRKDMF